MKAKKLKAWQVIEKYGWRQDYYGNEQTGYCLIGAIRKAYTNKMAQQRMFNLIKPYIHNEVLWIWNDQKGRTKRHVLTVLKKVEGGQ